MSMSRKVPTPPLEPMAGSVVPLNDHAALYLTLADEISGAAIGLSARGQALLRAGLVERFGDIFSAGGDGAVDELLRLATGAQAA